MDLSLPEAVLLGIVQGLTEWLPVSSSGHLVLVQQLLDIEQPLILDIVLHAGTLVVVLLFFRADIANVLTAVLKRDFAGEDGRLALYIVIGTIPIALAGYLLHDRVESLFDSALAVGIALLFTGLLLFASGRREGHRELGVASSLVVGVAQAVALVPGISRSGATISAGLLCGVAKEKVFRFSFLLVIPAIVGATLYEAGDIVSGDIQWYLLLLGAVVSTVVGYFSLGLLRRIVMQHRFHHFAWYCWALGLLVILLVAF